MGLKKKSFCVIRDHKLQPVEGLGEREAYKEFKRKDWDDGSASLVVKNLNDGVNVCEWG